MLILSAVYSAIPSTEKTTVCAISCKKLLHYSMCKFNPGAEEKQVISMQNPQTGVMY